MIINLKLSKIDELKLRESMKKQRRAFSRNDASTGCRKLLLMHRSEVWRSRHRYMCYDVQDTYMYFRFLIIEIII